MGAARGCAWSAWLLLWLWSWPTRGGRWRRRGAGRRRERRGWPRGGVLPAVRAVHGDAGDGAGEDRRRGGGQEELRRRELPLQLIVSILSRDRRQWRMCQL